MADIAAMEAALRSAARNNPDGLIDWLKTEEPAVQLRAYNAMVPPVSPEEELAELRNTRERLLRLDKPWVAEAVTLIDARIVVLQSAVGGKDVLHRE